MTYRSEVMKMGAQENHYDGIPGARKGNQAVVQYQAFETELEERSQSIASMLPSTVSIARFKNTVIAAVRQDPSILEATMRTVMAAVVRAAQDGLVPDGREGHIAVYNVNVANKKRNEPDRWERHAQWNPMAHGLRKRLRELDSLIANAEVVHENDTFVWRQGDEPRIEHEPAKLGTARGPMIGAYCIYKREDGTILHREVMDKTQIEMTRNQSKAKDSLMWTKFQSEGYRKSVLRRGIKTVPVGDTMREIIQRDDAENFDFTKAAEPAIALVPPSPPPAPLAIEQRQTVPDPSFAPVTEPALTDAETAALDRESMRQMRGETPEPGHDPERGEIIEPPKRSEPANGRWQSWCDAFIAKVEGADTPANLSKVLQGNDRDLDLCETAAPELARQALQAYRNRAAALSS